MFSVSLGDNMRLTAIQPSSPNQSAPQDQHPTAQNQKLQGSQKGEREVGAKTVLRPRSINGTG